MVLPNEEKGRNRISVMHNIACLNFVNLLDMSCKNLMRHLTHRFSGYDSRLNFVYKCW